MDQDYNSNSIPLNQQEELRNYEHYNIICYDYNVDISSEYGNLICGSYNFKNNSKETPNNAYYIYHILDNDGKLSISLTNEDIVKKKIKIYPHLLKKNQIKNLDMRKY